MSGIGPSTNGSLLPFDPANPRLTLKISESVAAGGEKRVLVADRFGQDMELDFPGKVKTEAELKSDVAADAKYYANLRPPATDPFGGLPGSGEKLGLKRTGYFHTEHVRQKDLLVNPEGNVTFHLGICGFQPSDDYTYIEGRESSYEWLPAYESEYKSAFATDPYWSHRAFSFYVANLIRKYGRPYNQEEWAERAIPRVRQWGFNASGAFSSVTEAQRKAHLPFVPFLPLGPWELGAEIAGLNGVFDPFDAQAIAKMDRLFSERLAPAANDPLIVGYFLANEQPLEDIPRVIPTLIAGQACKLRLIKMLQNKYHTVAAFNQAWDLKAGDFAELGKRGLPVTTKQAAADMECLHRTVPDGVLPAHRRNFPQV